MKKRKNIFCLLIAGVLCNTFLQTPYAFSQVSSLSPQLIGSTGNYSSAGFGSVSSSIGEPIVSTLSSGTITLTQGFQQPLGILSCPTSIGSLVAIPNIAICPGNSVTIAPSSIIPSTGSYTYSWSPGGQTTSSIVVNPTITTAYTFSVVGCPPAQTQTVIVNPTPVPQINGSNAFNGNLCFGQNASLSATITGSATGPYTYVWAPIFNLSCVTCANTIATSTISGTTIYSVAVTGSNGCQGVCTASVTISPKIILTGAYFNASCAGKCDGYAGVTTTNGSSPFTYAWSPGGETTQIISNLCAGPYSISVADAKGCVSDASFSIIAPPPLITKFLITPPLCGCNGSLYATPSGGTSPYTFSWSPGSAITPGITGLCGGSHSVSVTDAHGCNTITSATITPSPSVSVTATFPATICAGNATTIGVNTTGTPLVYSWSNGNTTGNIISVSPSVTTTYSVIVTNTLSGCSDTGLVPVVVNKLPVPTISANPSLSICSGYSATLTATNGINYLWSTNETTNPITASPSTSAGYTVTARDVNGCTNAASVFVTITSAPTPSITASANIICRGTTVTLAGSGGNSYFWSNTSQTNSAITVTPSATTTYTLIASNGSCTGATTLQVVVGSVVATISGNTNICLGDAATLTATAIPPIGNTYLWSPGNQASSTIIVSPTNQTTYGVMVTNSVSGCIGTETITVNIDPSPIATIATSTSTSICSGQSITLSAGPATAAYLWSTGETTQVIAITTSSPGINTYTLTAVQGTCSDDTSIAITVFALPSVTANANDSTICPGDSVRLTSAGSNAINYTWNPGFFSGPVFTVHPSSSMTYSVTVQDIHGCLNTATVPITFSSVTADAGNDLTICPGFTAQLNAIANGSTSTLHYVWSPGTYLNDSLVQNPSATPDSTTIFMVKAFNQDGCFGKDTVTVFVLFEAGCVIHIYNGITPNGDGDNDTWWIDGIRYFPDNNVSIFNRWGTEVWSASKYDNRNVVWKGFDSQGSPLPSGTYFYIVTIKLDNGSTQTFSKWLELTR